MPKLTCPGGHQINLSPIPNPAGFLLIREPAIETLVDQIADICQDEKNGEQFQRKVFDALATRHPDHFQVYECSVCGRLAILRDASASTPLAWYAPEAWSPEDDPNVTVTPQGA